MRLLAAIVSILLLISSPVCRAQEDPSGPHQLRLVQQLQQTQQDMQRLRRPDRLREQPSLAPPAARRPAPASAVPIVTTPSPLPPGTVGQFYRQQLAATGGKGPYKFELGGGQFPPGLGIVGDSIVGTPTGLGSTFAVRVIDSNKLSSTKSFSLAVRKAPAIQPQPPPPVAGKPSQAVTPGRLPSGTGAPAPTIKEPPLIVTANPLPAGVVGVSYQVVFAAEKGTQPYTFSIVSGAVPAGMTMTAKGEMLTGTPTAAGESKFTVKVTDTNGAFSTKDFSVTILASTALLPATILSGPLKIVGAGAPVSEPNATPLPATITSGLLKIVGAGALVPNPNATPLPATIQSGPLKIVGPNP